MTEHEDMETMIGILDIGVKRQLSEEDFFFRASRESKDKVARGLYSEIGEEIRHYRESLEHRKKQLEYALAKMKADEAAGAGKFDETLSDPVCKMQVDEKCEYEALYNNRKYHFCSPDCMRAFLMNPEEYTRKEAAASSV